MSSRELFVKCAAGCPEHTLKFEIFDADDPYIYVYVLLVEQPLFKRIWAALKYVCGYKSRFGHFDEVVLSLEESEKLETFLRVHNAANRNRTADSSV